MQPLPIKHTAVLASGLQFDAACRAVMDGLSVVVGLLALDGTILDANAACIALAGVPRSAAIGSKLWRTPCWTNAPDHEAPVRLRDAVAQAASGSSARYDTCLARPDGQPVWLDIALRPMRDPASSAVVALIAEAHDISEPRRLQADSAAREAALQASETRFRELYHRAPIPIHSIGPDGRLLDVSDEWVAFTGYSRQDVLGHSFSEFLDRESAERYLDQAVPELQREVQSWESRSVEYRLRKRSGDMADVVLTARPERDPVTGRFVRSLTVLSDVTARNRTEAALREKQHLAALGRMTGGVAHDFNNLLMAVLANLDLLRRRLGSDDPRIARPLDNAAQGAARGAALTRRLLASARQQDLRPDSVDMAALIADATEMLQPALGPGVRLEVDVADGLWQLHVDPEQFELALLNLAVNAHDAMPEGGTFRIAARNCVVSASDPEPAHPPLSDGDYGLVTITDTGTGMDPATLALATEPYFTTKGVGKGTGLGLSMVHGFVGQSGGAMRLTSTPGQGTTVEIWLRCAMPAAEAPRADLAHSDTGDDAAPPSRRLRILLVDDDALVRVSTGFILEELGHHVVAEADSGEAALKLLREGDGIDLLLTDQAMPGMTGLELIARARAIRTSLPVLLASGYSELDLGESADIPRLSKPYRLEDLGRALSAIRTIVRNTT